MSVCAGIGCALCQSKPFLCVCLCVCGGIGCALSHIELCVCGYSLSFESQRLCLLV